MNYRLQPLRIPTGWTVTFNGGLYEVDPDPNAVFESDYLTLFKEDMLQIEQRRFNRLLDVGWYPEGDLVQGSYGLFVYEGDFHGRCLYELRTRDRRHLVAEIERLLQAICDGAL